MVSEMVFKNDAVVHGGPETWGIDTPEFGLCKQVAHSLNRAENTELGTLIAPEISVLGAQSPKDTPIPTISFQPGLWC
jgi:hypothetical protein